MENRHEQDHDSGALARRWVAVATVAAAAWLCLAVVEAQSDQASGTQGLAHADLAYSRGDVTEAIRLYREAAERGIARAQVKLGFIYDNAEENVEAARWYRQAADQGDADGRYWLGRLYLTGEGVARDVGQGVNLLTEAARGGSLLANVMLARAYETGDMGLQPDAQQARDHWRRAAELGEHSAMERLAAAHRNGELGLAVDIQEAERWEARVGGGRDRSVQ